MISIHTSVLSKFREKLFSSSVFTLIASTCNVTTSSAVGLVSLTRSLGASLLLFVLKYFQRHTETIKTTRNVRTGNPMTKGKLSWLLSSSGTVCEIVEISFFELVVVAFLGSIKQPGYR
mmetsp:Transcript_12319/g.22321  ORF Transcript_12319/g.22321 Transcript_12319/m.22321 type:complete len:119 (-) Transcript_12319:232-588(-)